MIVNDKNNNEIYRECDILKIKTIFKINIYMVWKCRFP